MLIITLSSTSASIPSMIELHAKGLLAAVVCPNRQSEDISLISQWAQAVGLCFKLVQENNFESIVKTLAQETKAEMALTFGFPYKIPSSLFNHFTKGFLNVHFSPLPSYRGPSPVFWQIKNGEKTTGISIHHVDSGWDTGTIIKSLEAPIYPGETTGLCTARLAHLSVGLLKEVLEQGLEAKKEHSVLNPSYHKRPTIADMCIDWGSDSAVAIEQLVNACNPVAVGAISSFRGQTLRLLEVSPVDGLGNPNIRGGTVVHADMSGLFIQCKDQRILRINILKINEGILTGFKFAALGVKAGDIFENYNYNLN